MGSSSQPLTAIDLATAGELAAQFRVDSVRSSTSAGSGHPTSSMSAADLLAVLVARHLRYDCDNPRGGGGVGGGADDRIPALGVPAGRPPHPCAAMGGRGYGIFGPGPARRGGC